MTNHTTPTTNQLFLKKIQVIEKTWEITLHHPLDPIVVCLVGPSQTGKTRLVQELAKSHKLTPIFLNPAQDLPEEIMGMPLLTNDTTMKILKPWWFPSEPSCIFLDEIDKAREEVLSSLLTLLSENRVRAWKLPPGSIVVTAMNPPRKSLQEALIERLLFIPFGDDLEYWKFILPDWSELLNKIFQAREFSVPTHTLSLGTLCKIKKFESCPEFWADGDFRKIVLNGLLSAEIAQKLEQELLLSRILKDEFSSELFALYLRNLIATEAIDLASHTIPFWKGKKGTEMFWTIYQWLLEDSTLQKLVAWQKILLEGKKHFSEVALDSDTLKEKFALISGSQGVILEDSLVAQINLKIAESIGKERLHDF